MHGATISILGLEYDVPCVGQDLVITSGGAEGEHSHTGSVSGCGWYAG
jgi:hypothetical protein